MCAGTVYDIVYMQLPRWRSENLEASCSEEFAIEAEESEKTPMITPKKSNFREYQPGKLIHSPDAITYFRSNTYIIVLIYIANQLLNN